MDLVRFGGSALGCEWKNMYGTWREQWQNVEPPGLVYVVYVKLMSALREGAGFGYKILDPKFISVI